MNDKEINNNQILLKRSKLTANSRNHENSTRL